MSTRPLHGSAVTLGEIQVGLELTRDQDAARAAAIESGLNHVAGVDKVLPMDGAACRRCAQPMHRRSETCTTTP